MKAGYVSFVAEAVACGVSAMSGFGRFYLSRMTGLRSVTTGRIISPDRKTDTTKSTVALKTGSRSLSANVLLKLLNEIVLFRDNVLDQVSNGDHTNELVILYNGKMAHVALGHELHAAFCCFFRRDRNDRSAHDVPHGCL